jgi:hypothetical protein
MGDQRGRALQRVSTEARRYEKFEVSTEIPNGFRAEGARWAMLSIPPNWRREEQAAICR